MALTTLDGIAAGMIPPVIFNKASQTSEGAGTFHSLWKAAGYPAAGSNPPAFSAGSGYTCDRTTAGALPFANPGSGETLLAKLAAASSTVGTLILCDRLWTCSGFACNTTSTQTITTPGSIPSRDANGASNGDGVEIWGEVYSAPGATGSTFTVSYTDQSGNTGNSATYTHPANAETAGQMVPFTLASGDTGVRAVASLALTPSTGTAGDFGISLIRRICSIPLNTANVGAILDGGAVGWPNIYNDSCLFLMVMCSTTNTGLVLGEAAWSQG